MRMLIKASTVAAIIAAGFALSAPASAGKQRTPNPACATDETFHPDEAFFVKQCAKFNRDGTCARYRVITCQGRTDGKR